MKNRTPLHTHYKQLDLYHLLVHNVLQELATDADKMLASNRAEWDAWPQRGAHLAERMQVESWVEHTTDQLRDLLYLLAVGDNAAADVADADPDRADKDQHYKRARDARERLDESGLLRPPPTVLRAVRPLPE